MKESTYKLQGTTVKDLEIYTEENLVVQGYSGAGKSFPLFITEYTEEGGTND